MVKAIDFIPFRKLPVELVSVTVYMGGKSRPFKTVYHIVDVLETGAGKIFCGETASGPITGDDKKIVCLFEYLAYLFDKALILYIEPKTIAVILLDKLLGHEHVGKQIGTNGVPHKLEFGPRPDINEIGIGDRVEHVIGFNAQDNFGLLGRDIK